jgi:hypothetical protein
MIAELDAFARAGDGLVTGEPGVGKTHSITELHDLWNGQNFPHLAIPVDRLGSATEAEIRSALGISTSLMDHVERYFSERGRGVLIIDGFDSARSESSRERVLALIREALDRSDGRWSVIVTVRIYDATRSQSLRNLFIDPAIGAPAKGIGLSGTRHYLVPKLAHEEVEQGIAQISGLPEVYSEATQEFRDLLRIPFNLWLVEGILGGAASSLGLSAVASEVQLLGLYWERRVDSGDRAPESRHLLSGMVQRMVASHVLSLRVDEVFHLGAASVWDDLLSAGVLQRVGSTGQRIAFAHNTLFDYATSILLLEDDPRAMHDFIAADFGRPLFLRPSITFYYTRLWYDGREAFWKSTRETLQTSQPQVRLVGRLVPPSVIVREARLVSDFEPVVAGAMVQDGLSTELGLRILQAASALDISDDVLWAEVCCVLAGHPQREFAWNVVTIGHRIAERRKDSLGGSLAENLGLLGRRMLAWALQQEGDQLADAVGANWALPLVCRTFSTAPAESDALLRRILSLLETPGFQVRYFTQLSDNVDVLAPVAPRLVGDIYRAVFAYSETSDEETNFGGPILPLRSTRRQDFGMCEYILDKQFLAFLEAAPEEAVQAALDAFNTYVLNDQVKPYLRKGRTVSDTEYVLRFRGQDLVVAADHSAVWLDTAHPDTPLSLLRRVLDWIKTAADRRDTATLQSAVDMFARRARVQAAWVELIKAGAACPNTLGVLLSDLAVSRRLQANVYHEVVNLVAAAVALWTPDERIRYERSVESLYRDAQSEEDPGRLTKLADRLATAIPRDLTRSPVLLERRDSLEASDAIPHNDPPFHIEVTSAQFTNEDWLSERGVDVGAPGNRALLDASSSLENSIGQWRNKRAPAAELVPIYGEMENARDLLRTTPNASTDVVETLETRIASAAVVIAEAEGEVPEGLTSAARTVLLAAAQKPINLTEEDELRDFDVPSWSPVPQTEAAQGLPWLALRERDEQVLDAIEHLSRSPEPSVRFLTATEVFRLRKHAEDRFWTIVDRLAETESSKGVLAGLMQSLGRVTNQDAPRIADVLDKLLERGLGPDDRSQYADNYVQLLAWLGFNVQDTWAVGLLDAIARQPLANLELAKRISFEAFTIVTPAYLANARVRPMALRAVAWIRRLLASIHQISLQDLAGEAHTERTRGVYLIIDEIAARTYFGVKAESDNGEPRAQDIAEYFQLVRPVVEDLIRFGRRPDAALLAHSAHHLIEFLHRCLPLDPQVVLHLAADVVTSGERGGYSLDGMAVREVVEIAEELLADHRASISGGQSLEDFVRLLDSFANHGWPEALHMLWRIDEIFR